MTARSHTRSMHKQKKRRQVAHLRWRLRTGQGPPPHRADSHSRYSASQRRNRDEMEMEEKGYNYED